MGLTEDDSGQLSWHEGGIAAFESDWIALHRFLWLNDLKGTTFWHQIRTRVGKWRTATSSQQPVAKTMMEWDVTRTAGGAIFAKSLGNVIGETAAKHIGSRRTLRYCPLCLARGFHSHLFYFEVIECCPHHKCQLVDACRFCGKRIGRPLLIPDDFKCAYACASCSAPFVDEENLASALLGDFPEAMTTFGRVHHRLLRMRRIEEVHLDGYCSDAYALSDHHLHLSHCFLAAVSADRLIPELRMRGLTRYSASPSHPAWGFAAQSFMDDRGLQDRKPIRSDAEAAAAIVKSIHRQLVRRTFAICGHRHPLQLNAYLDIRSFTEREMIAWMRGDDCPCCSVMSWWRAEMSKLLALDRCLERAEQSTGGVAVEGRSDLSADMLVGRPFILARAAISTFARMCWAVWEIIHTPLEETFATKGTDAFGVKWHCNDEEYILSLRRRWGRPLPIQRHLIRPAHVRLRTEAGWIHFAHSLRGAIAALEECVSSFRKQSVAWQMDTKQKLEPIGKPSFIPLDIWHRDSVGAYALSPARDVFFIRYPEDEDPQLDLFAPRLKRSV